MTEVKLWGTIRKKLSPRVHAMRVENLLVAGPFDVNMSRDGCDIWMELKIMEKSRITVRHSQVNWALARLRSGASNLYFVVWKDGDRGSGNGDLLIWNARALLPVIMNARKDPKKFRARIAEKEITFDPGRPEYVCFYISDLEKYLFHYGDQRNKYFYNGPHS